MLLASLLLASHCADAGSCPTQGQLKRAIGNYRETAETAFFLGLSEADRGTISLTPWRRVVRVSDIGCGAGFGEGPSVICRVTLHFREGRERTAFRLQRRGPAWRVVEEVAAASPA